MLMMKGRLLLHELKRSNIVSSSFPRHYRPHSSVPAAQGCSPSFKEGVREATRPRTATSLRSALYGVTKISPLRGERFVRNILKYGTLTKSHAALRFLPLRNCVVSSVKKRELSEALRTK